MSGGLVRFLAGLPVIGYLLKVAHDLVMLPKLRADLHRDTADLAARHEVQLAWMSDHASRLHVLSDGLAALAESVARLRQSQIQQQENAAETRQMHLLRAQSDRQEALLAAVSERLTPLEAHTATRGEQLETLLQRVSDNLAEWVELRQRQAEAAAQQREIEQRLGQATAQIAGLQAKADEMTTQDQMVVVRLDDAAAKVQELQSQLNSQEDAFAGVLRRHTRILAELRDAIISRRGDPDRNGGDMQLLDSFRDLLAGRWMADAPAIPEVPELPRRFQPAVRLLLGETVPGGRFSFRVASAAGREADVIADFSELPFGPGAVAEIRAGDILDRCTPKEGRRLLAHWSNVLWSGGALYLTITDLEAAERTYSQVSSAFGELSRAVLSQRGERRKPFNRETVQRLLREAGFEGITEQSGKDTSPGFRIEIQATKGDGTSA